jgi:hypothetical protein
VRRKRNIGPRPSNDQCFHRMSLVIKTILVGCTSFQLTSADDSVVLTTNEALEQQEVMVPSRSNPKRGLAQVLICSERATYSRLEDGRHLEVFGVWWLAISIHTP